MCAQAGRLGGDRRAAPGGAHCAGAKGPTTTAQWDLSLGGGAEEGGVGQAPLVGRADYSKALPQPIALKFGGDTKQLSAQPEWSGVLAKLPHATTPTHRQ